MRVEVIADTKKQLCKLPPMGLGYRHVYCVKKEMGCYIAAVFEFAVALAGSATAHFGFLTALPETSD